jgi:hypothetical protein
MRISSSGIIVALALLSSPAKADGGAQHQVKQTPPVKMGTSGGSLNDISRFFCCGGTLGALVMRDGVLCILSNNHILARSGSASTGEDTLQPGLIDSNCSGGTSNVVGDFIGNLVPLGTGNVDAALSVARAGMVDTSGFILDIGAPRTTVQAPTIGLAVMKSGRTSGFTTGNITSINTTVTIQYQKGCNQGKKFNITFTGQIVTGAMSAGGDSGSLLVSNDGSPNPVGLLFAGSSSTTIYNRAQDVVNAFSAGGHSFSFVGSAPLVVDTLDTKGQTQRSPRPEDVQMAVQVKEANEADLFRNPGVLGVGVGAADDNPLEAAIVVYFDNSKSANIPPRIGGFKTRVILTDPIVAQ